MPVLLHFGAPIMNDFAVLSLSDRLTPWNVIEKRINKSAEADFVIVLYNPKVLQGRLILQEQKRL